MWENVKICEIILSAEVCTTKQNPAKHSTVCTISFTKLAYLGFVILKSIICLSQSRNRRASWCCICPGLDIGACGFPRGMLQCLATSAVAKVLYQVKLLIKALAHVVASRRIDGQMTKVMSDSHFDRHRRFWKGEKINFYKWKIVKNWMVVVSFLIIIAFWLMWSCF